MGKTVTTYLIDGDPKGTQYAFISNKICQMFVVPRSNLSYLNTQEKLQKPAFYILLGEDESTKPQAYIGETENFKERVKDHDSKKSFWQKALIFVSKDADMTKVDVQYLEHKAIAEAKKANAFVLSDNKQIPKAPNLPEHQQDSMNEFFEDVKFLASFIGCNIFEVSQPKEEHLFYTKGRGCNAKGFYSSPVLPQISVLVAATTAGWYGKIKKEIHWTQFIENSWINNISVGGKYGNYQSTRLHRPHRVERMAEGQP